MTTNNKKTVHPILQMEGRGKLIIRENVKKKIDILHREFGNNEWSGVLFYNKLEGSISDPSTYVAEVVDIYPMDKGSAAYTEFNFTGEEMLLMADRVDAYMTSRTGLLHSHHNMRAYFSGEDMDELHTNVENYSKNGSYYLSLIVNFEEKYVAKIVKLIDVPASKITIDEEGEDASHIQTFSKQMMLSIDLDIEIENTLHDEDLMKRIAELVSADEEKKRLAAAKTKTLTVAGKQYPKFTMEQPSYEDWTSKWGDNTLFDEPYIINPTSIKKNLNQILDLDVETKRETGQILASLHKMSNTERESRLEEIADNMYLMTVDMFGFDQVTPALEETYKQLKTFSHVTLWSKVLDELGEIFEEAIETSQYIVE